MDDDFFAFGVTDPKGSSRETPGMTTDPRSHIRRRDGALVRLRGLTATAAVAGVAGTAVFGAVAAASWSGDPSVRSAAELGTGTTPSDAGLTGPQTAPEQNPAIGPNAKNGSSGTSGQAANPGTTRVRPSFGGRSHATTGGSR